MKTIYFVTTNPLKVKIANAILKKYGIKVIPKNIELPEIQSFNGQIICEYASKYAREILNKPVVTTDASYSISALNGFPGPLVKFINKWFSAKDILKMMEGKTDRNMIIIEYLSYCDENRNLTTFQIDIPCKITKKILNKRRGTTFDKITIREGINVPQNMLDKKELEKLFLKQMKNWEDFGRFLLAKDNNSVKNKEKFYPLEIPFNKIIKRKKHGILVAVEGIDGAGKTTLVKKIFNELTKKKIKCSILKTFAGNSAFHSTLMEVKNLMAQFKDPLPGEIEQIIYTIEFLTYVTSNLPKLLVNNKVVLVDGYIMRRIALSRWNTKKKNSIPESIILKFIQKKLFPLPDITFYLDISIDEARKRVIRREYENFNKFNLSDLVLLRLEEKEKSESIKKLKFESELLIKDLKKSQKIIILNVLNTPDYLAQKCVKEILHT